MVKCVENWEEGTPWSGSQSPGTPTHPEPERWWPAELGLCPREAGSVRTDCRGPCSGPVSARLFVCHLHGVSWGLCLNSDIYPPTPAVAPQSTFFVGFPYDLRKLEV